MATPQHLTLSKEAQASIIKYHKAIRMNRSHQWDFREHMRTIDLAYLREQDLTTEHLRAANLNRLGDSSRIQNITIPVIKPQVVSAVAYQSAVFLNDYPIFGVQSDPIYMDQAMQMQALFEENSVRAAWVPELIQFFYDGFKYNASATEASWERVITPGVTTDINYKGGQEGKPVDIIWEGNVLKRWDMYNTVFDTAVALEDIPSHGDFVGHTELITRVGLKKLMLSLTNKIIANENPAFESPNTLQSVWSGAGEGGYYIPQLNPGVISSSGGRDTDNWNLYLGLNQSTGLKLNYKGIYELSTEYYRLIPSDFGMAVPQPNTPQIWKFLIINHNVVISAERQTNAHEKIPVFFGQPADDGLGYQSKSLATDGMPFQQVASAIMNGVLAARRRSIGDRTLYDPSRIAEHHINNPNPAAKIPVRPTAYGKPVGEAVYQFPFRDDQSAMGLQEISQLVGLANMLSGQNAARQGQFIKGNKTDGQWESTMSNATSTDQLTALKLEGTVFTPMKEVLKLNYLQYQGATTVYSPTQQKAVQVDPVALRQAVINFKVTDGLLPKDKVMSTEARKVAMQVIGSSPALAGAYNVAPLFTYIMKLENVNLGAFEKSQPQLAYEQASAAWGQAAQMAIQKGVPFNVPQPVPQQFGFDPNTVDPAKQVPTASTSPQQPDPAI